MYTVRTLRGDVNQDPDLPKRVPAVHSSLEYNYTRLLPGPESPNRHRGLPSQTRSHGYAKAPLSRAIQVASGLPAVIQSASQQIWLSQQLEEVEVAEQAQVVGQSAIVVRQQRIRA